MIVVYKLETLEVEQCVFICADDYLQAIDADPMRGWVRFDGDARPHEIGIKIIDGSFAAVRKIGLPIDAPSSVALGEIVVIGNVPAGTHVWGDAGAGVVDANGVVEISFETPGSYTLAFLHPEYLLREVAIAVTSV